MAAPTPPFSTSAAVAYLSQVSLRQAADYTADSSPNKEAVEQFITWTDAAIQLQFQQAGYKVPLAEITGESWPASQTTYLQLVSVLGAGAMATGHSQKPAPAMAPGQRGGKGNTLQDLFDAEMDKIFRLLPNGRGLTTLRFRADYYPGTLAERSVVNPRGPTTDFLEGKFDPERYLGNVDIANKVMAVQQSMTDLDIQWDYLYGLFDLNKGFGRSVHE